MGGESKGRGVQRGNRQGEGEMAVFVGFIPFPLSLMVSPLHYCLTSACIFELSFSNVTWLLLLHIVFRDFFRRVPRRDVGNASLSDIEKRRLHFVLLC